jgi:hypothetical protein
MLLCKHLPKAAVPVWVVLAVSVLHYPAVPVFAVSSSVRTQRPLHVT